MLCIVKSKGCKRCGGDLSLECDIYGVYAECIQCGANWSQQDMMLITTKKAGEKPKAAADKPLAPTRHGH